VDKLSQLASLKVSKALLVKENDLGAKGEEVDVELIKIGDLVKVINGQTFPIDGKVTAGNCLSNESMLTGEEKPV
jgi:P-type E1-E2 ATPase